MVLQTVYELRRMLHTHTYGNALSFHYLTCITEAEDILHAGNVRKVSIYITCRMSCGKDYGISPEGGCSLSADAFHALHTAFVIDEEARHLGLEMHLTAAAEYLQTHALNDSGQLVRAYVRMNINENTLPGTELAKDIQHLIGVAALLAAGEQLAIRIGSCPTLAKTVVTLRIHALLMGDACQVFLTLTHILSPLYHDGTQPQLNELQGSEEAGWPCTDNDDRRATRHIRVIYGGKEFIGGQLVDIDAYGKINVNLALACINAAFQNAEMLYCAPIYAIFATDIFRYILLAICHLRHYPKLNFFYHGCKGTKNNS